MFLFVGHDASRDLLETASILGSFTELKDSTSELSGQLGNTALYIPSLNADDFLAGCTILYLLQVSCFC